jgi:hypothetical protein
LSRKTKVDGMDMFVFNFNALNKALNLDTKTVLLGVQGAKSVRVRMVHPGSAVKYFKVGNY